MNVYEMVTDRILEKLKEGKIPWKKCWKSASSYAYNRVSKKPYSLLNQLLLSKNGEYASFKQWKKLGGHIKKGAKGEIVVFWKWLKKEKEDENGESTLERIPVLKYYTVFHISQVEGVDPLEKEDLSVSLFESIECAEEIKEDYLNREHIAFEENKFTEASYSPANDKIEVPTGERFQKPEEYYATLFHEMVHSTGHPSRLNRDLSGRFGSKKYAAEELVAEIGSAILLSQTGIETDATFENSTAYVQSWIAHLKNDSRMIVLASGKAEKAVNFIENVA